MSKMSQIRNVPDSLHRTLKAQASLAGMSLSDFLLSEIRHLAERPTVAELRERLRHRSRTANPLFLQTRYSRQKPCVTRGMQGDCSRCLRRNRMVSSVARRGQD
jgi:hypothetical protein